MGENGPGQWSTDNCPGINVNPFQVEDLFCLFFALVRQSRFCAGFWVIARQEGNCRPTIVFERPLTDIAKRFSMTSSLRTNIRKRAGTILLVAGMLFWTLVIVLPLAPLHMSWLNSLGHVQKQSLGVVAGGASLAGGIVFLLAPRRRRRRRYITAHRPPPESSSTTPPQSATQSSRLDHSATYLLLPILSG